MQVLLQNASEVITIYEADGNVRYISPSVEKILGYEQAELIGQSDKNNIKKEDRKKWEEMFKKLLAKPDKPVTLQYAYKKKDGKEVMLEAMGKNLISDAAIQGIVVNSRDITERIRAEKEERMRSQMQALSENSPDLITRLTTEGEFFYINPVIETYTGNKADQFLNKNMEKVDLDEQIVSQWKQILEDVGETNAKVSREMDFPSKEMGERIMQVNAIPEYNEDENLESVLVVSHDITSRKLIELEIQSKNKKITESINYAQRIQGSILPNNRVVNRALPDSFIYYKARDVVSGDFPWFLQKGDDIFIAAVDCTGHGVPGALISLIGYFLLNDIVRSRNIHDPGVVLDLLDEGVTQTLRQDVEGAKSKDGMDIAILKINTQKQTIEFAGAHRPLYYMDSGEMVEIKGNKFAIGGGIYKNQTNFTNHKIKYKKGDSVYFCSDGFPDQFGGPEGRKFGPKRTRDLIARVHKKPMDEINEIFDKEWTEWKGDQKQIDDVLMIGIKCE
jgi:PAS domain S-box-containing protein